MKKELYWVALFMLLPSVLAVDITLTKESYQPLETLQAEIVGNFISLNEENVLIYREGKVHDDPVIKGFTKQNNVYYFYAVTPRQEGNYSLVIENAEYLDRGEVTKQRIEIPFTLEEKNISDLSFSPGFVIPTKDFTISVKSFVGITKPGENDKSEIFFSSSVNGISILCLVTSPRSRYSAFSITKE